MSAACLQHARRNGGSDTSLACQRERRSVGSDTAYLQRSSGDSDMSPAFLPACAEQRRERHVPGLSVSVC